MWTEERTERVKSLWAAGASAGQIARELGGVSRNAVIGKLHRIGAAERSAAYNARNRRRSAINAAVIAGLKSGLARRRAEKAKSPVRKLLEATVPPTSPPVPRPVARIARVADLEPHHCRYPVGEPGTAGFGFCGEPTVAGTSYCAGCCRIVFAPRLVKPAVEPEFQAVEPARNQLEPA